MLAPCCTGRRLLSLGVALVLMAAACTQAEPTTSIILDQAVPPTPVLTTSPLSTVAPAAPPTASQAQEPTAPPATTTPAPQPTPTVEPTTPPTATPTATPEPEPVAESLADALAASTLEPLPCPANVAADGVICAQATVPLHPSDPVPGETVTVMTALVDNGDPLDIGPVVFLQGGPGVGSTTLAQSFVGADHDALFVDQRGTGHSTPKLSCPEADELWAAQFSDDPAVRSTNPDTERIAAYRSCGTRLTAEGVQFDAFNTATAAADIELLRQLYGFEQWSLWGSSYGTRLGLTIMRDYPAGVRAAVLDSVVPFEVDFFASLPGNALRSMTALDQACDVAQCAQDHGDFLETLAALTRELDENPAVVQATRPVSGTTFPFRVEGSDLIDMVFTQLYNTSALPSLPRQVSRAEFGGLDELVGRYLGSRDPEQFDFAIALYYTTWCREEFPFFDPSGDDAVLNELRPDFGDAFTAVLSNDGVGQVCDIFTVPAGPAIDDAPLSSDIPAVVFAGAFDPITPPSWSRAVADALSNSTFVLMNNHGHGMATACPGAIRLAFLRDPTTPPDTSCALASGPPAFD